MNKGMALGGVVLLVAVVGFVVYPAKGDERLLGTWEIDLDAVRKTPKFQQASEHEREIGLQLLKAMKIQIVFTQDRVKLGGPLADMANGTDTAYRVVESNQTSVTLEIDQDGTWRRQVFHLDGDRMTIHHNGRDMSLRRARG